MLMRFDNAQIEGLFSTDGYIDLSNRGPADAAQLIHERIRAMQSESSRA